jgi:hypothetical protein
MLQLHIRAAILFKPLYGTQCCSCPSRATTSSGALVWCSVWQEAHKRSCSVSDVIGGVFFFVSIEDNDKTLQWHIRAATLFLTHRTVLSGAAAATGRQSLLASLCGAQ